MMIVKTIYDSADKKYLTLNIDGPVLSMILHKSDLPDVKVTLDKRSLPFLILSLQEIQAHEDMVNNLRNQAMLTPSEAIADILYDAAEKIEKLKEKE